MTLTIIELPKRKPRKWPRKASGRKKPKKTIVGLWRKWLVPDNAYRRYVGLRGIYWYWLSRDVRKSEWVRWNKLCLTCLLPVENWEKDGQCGHVIPSDDCGEYLRLNRRNLTLQHSWCNNPKITPRASVLNARNYNMRFGEGAYEALEKDIKLQVKQPTTEGYKYLILSLPSYQEAVVKV